MAKQEINLTKVQYDQYITTAGLKQFEIIETANKINDNGVYQFRLKCLSQNGETHYEEHTLNEYGQRKLKKFIDATETLTEKEQENFDENLFLGKHFQFETFMTINKHYEKTNPNSREYYPTIKTSSYASWDGKPTK